MERFSAPNVVDQAGRPVTCATPPSAASGTALSDDHARFVCTSSFVIATTGALPPEAQAAATLRAIGCPA
jgi:hypothetical protein